MKTLFRVLSVASVVCLLAAYASAGTIIVGEPRPPINPEFVKVYWDLPRKFDRIAIITKGSGGSWAFSDEGQVNNAIAKIKVEAAKLGANGIHLQAVEERSSGGIGIGIGGFGIGRHGGGHHGGGHEGGGHHGIGVGGSFYAPIINKKVEAIAFYVRKK
jgi:hypothetical protein